MEELPYRTNVTTGEALKKLLHDVRRYEKRDSFEKLHRYLYGSGYGRVCILYGLRRTGKTTLLFQAMAEMNPEDFAKAVYIKLRPTDEMDMVARDLDQLQKEGYQYIFLDEVTLMKDFIDSAALLSDIYAMMGMKIVLSGTDSLGFWIARDYELYDRERTIHTTFIPFREYSRLLGIDSIDEYIRYGGTLRAGELTLTMRTPWRVMRRFGMMKIQDGILIPPLQKISSTPWNVTNTGTTSTTYIRCMKKGN